MLNTPGLNDDQRIAILGGTAARLLGITLDTTRGETRPQRKGRPPPRRPGVAGPPAPPPRSTAQTPFSQPGERPPGPRRQ